MQLCTWDDYHIFLIATLVFTRLLLNEIYHLIELLSDCLMMCCWVKFVCLLIWLVFVTAIWHERNRWTWTRIDYITLVLQANRLYCASHPKTKCASHPKPSVLVTPTTSVLVTLTFAISLILFVWKFISIFSYAFFLIFLRG